MKHSVNVELLPRFQKPLPHFEQLHFHLPYDVLSLVSSACPDVTHGYVLAKSYNHEQVYHIHSNSIGYNAWLSPEQIRIVHNFLVRGESRLERFVLLSLFVGIEANVGSVA